MALRGVARLAIPALLALAADRGAAAQEASFGPGVQMIHLGPISFRPTISSLGFGEDTAGYLYGDAGALMIWVAPISLPEGAELMEMCLYAWDVDPSRSISLYLDALPHSGVNGGIEHTVVPAVHSDFNDGFGVTCSGPLSYTWRENRDLDGDGIVDSAPYRLVVYAEGGFGLGLGGVRLRFRRRVSPAPQSPSFLDVPANHPFFQFIEALSKSGITAGCGSGRYCPDAPLTRAQMAAFLAKALGLQWP